jgi:biopolymer transport protein ExbD
MIAMAFSTNGGSVGSGLSSEINVTPLIDVLLVMLIIFMVIVAIRPHGLGASLPSVARRARSTTIQMVLFWSRSSGDRRLYVT